MATTLAPLNLSAHFAFTQARVDFTINLPEAPVPVELTLTWQGFNAAVQSVDVVTTGAAATRREQPRASATLALSRSDQGQWASTRPAPTQPTPR